MQNDNYVELADRGSELSFGGEVPLAAPPPFLRPSTAHGGAIRLTSGHVGPLGVSEADAGRSRRGHAR